MGRCSSHARLIRIGNLYFVARAPPDRAILDDGLERAYRARMRFDENGWAEGAVKPLAPGEAWSLLAPDASSRVEAERWAHQAETFFRARIEVVEAKKYPNGALPMADALHVDVRRKGDEKATRVLVITVPIDRAPDVREQAALGVQAIGGAGFDALVAKAMRVWQVAKAPIEGDDFGAPPALAAVLALVLLAPVVPPDEVTIFGVKGARQRLEARGWKT